MHFRLGPHAGLAAFALASIAARPDAGAAVFAARVIDYQAGSGAALGDPDAALGQPDPIVGAGTGFDSILNTFNPPYESSQIVQIGEGGSLTLQLSHFAVTTAGLPEIGIFANVGIGDTDFPNGVAGADLSAPFATFGIDFARIEVSADGGSWFDLGLVALDQPSNFYADLPTPSTLATAGLTQADFGQSHAIALADYAGRDWAAIKNLLAGSAGGTWIELGATGLAQVGWLRLSLPDDGDPGTSLSVEIDAVSVENRAAGAPVPEPSPAALVLTAMLLALRRHRR